MLDALVVEPREQRRHRAAADFDPVERLDRADLPRRIRQEGFVGLTHVLDSVPALFDSEIFFLGQLDHDRARDTREQRLVARRRLEHSTVDEKEVARRAFGHVPLGVAHERLVGPEVIGRGSAKFEPRENPVEVVMRLAVGWNRLVRDPASLHRLERRVVVPDRFSLDTAPRKRVDLDDDRRDDLCNEAAQVAIGEGKTEISMDDFQTAWDKISSDGNDQDDAERAPEADPQATANETNVLEEPSAMSSEGGGQDGAEADADGDQDDTETDEATESEQSSTRDPSTMDRDALEAEVAELRDAVDDLREVAEEAESAARDAQARVEAVRRQMATQAQLLVGEDTIQDAGINPDNVINHHQRLSDITDQVEEHSDQIQMVRTDGGGGRDDPDSRAQLIRQTLYNKAKNHTEGQAQMDRDAVDSRLGGGLHRDTVLDAMKRAADGYEAEADEREYTSINGSSDLQPVESIAFAVGEGRGTASKLVMNVADATGAEIRQNLTTENSEGGE